MDVSDFDNIEVREVDALHKLPLTRRQYSGISPAEAAFRFWLRWKTVPECVWKFRSILCIELSEEQDEQLRRHFGRE